MKHAEIEEQLDRREREELEQNIRRRVQTRLDLDRQKQEMALRKLQEEDDMKAYRAEQLRLLAEQDKLELMTNEKKRLKLAEHNRAVRQLMDERKQKRDAEYLAMMQAHEADVEWDKRRYNIFFLINMDGQILTFLFILCHLQTRNHRRRTHQNSQGSCRKSDRIPAAWHFTRK